MPIPKRPASYDKKVGLVLQGGGALGSYQAGVYEALAGSDYPPDWVAGISIGAINAAIIAGNPPARRVEKLRDFWETITSPSQHWPMMPGWPFDVWQQHAGAAAALLCGQPGFFAPHMPQAWLTPQTMVSYYDTSALKRTLERVVDFDLINSGKGVRLSVGAVNVRNAHFDYFDSAAIAIRPEHVMASGALPPGFPPVAIDGECYWDGGLYSNTPLQYMLDYSPRRSRIVFQVDVFAGHGRLPTNLDEVSEREKDLRYASRTRATTQMYKYRHDVRHAINELHRRLPPEIQQWEEARRLWEYGCVTQMDIAQLIYRPHAPQGSHKDYEFSRKTMNARWEAGRADAQVTLESSPWLAPMPQDEGLRVFDVVHERLVGKN